MRRDHSLTLRSLLFACALLPGVACLGDTPQAPVGREVWIALRADGEAGTGSVTDPFDGSSVARLNGLFDTFRHEFGENLVVHFGPGTFYGSHRWEPMDNWKIRGAGIDVTIIKTAPDADGVETVGFRGGASYHGPGLVGFEMSDLTFDFNTPALRKANRAFVYPRGRGWVPYQFHAKDLPEWSPGTAYKRGGAGAVSYEGGEYIALKASTGQEPGRNEYWSPLRPNQPELLPAWEPDREYSPGEAVRVEDRGFICIADETAAAPATGTGWAPIDPAAPDPFIYTHAAFIGGRPPRGQHRVSRVKAINGHGSSFLGREAFVIGLGGNDNVIEDCTVELFLGDYSTLMVVQFGHNNVIRNCTARGNNGLATMGYGGWACYDTVFEGNFAKDMRSATNIDSLTCRNVTFRNNTFMSCKEVGILINVGGGPVGSCLGVTTQVDGEEIEISRSTMDGVFIHDNFVQMQDNAPYGAIQVQQEGMTNAWIYNNVLRTVSMKGAGARAIGVLGTKANAVIHDNVCDPGMYCEIQPQGTIYNNYDFAGKPMVDRFHKNRPMGIERPPLPASEGD